MKGRIDQASISESARRLLPKNERYTKLLIEKIHKESLHSGVPQCLSQMRNRYWIPQGRATVRSVLRSCTICDVTKVVRTKCLTWHLYLKHV